MSITLGQILIFQTGLRQDKSIYCGLGFNRFASFFESANILSELPASIPVARTPMDDVLINSFREKLRF